MLVQLAIFVGGEYIVFFRLKGDWTKWVGFAVWILAMWGVTRVGERQI
jgi:hypothetical protein